MTKFMPGTVEKNSSTTSPTADSNLHLAKIRSIPAGGATVDELFSLVLTSDISIGKITKYINFPLRFTKTKQKEFSFEFAFVLP